MVESAENELKTPKRTLEKRLERRPNGTRAAFQLFIMMCLISSDGIMADVYCVDEHAMFECEHGWQKMYNYRHIEKTYTYSPVCQTCRQTVLDGVLDWCFGCLTVRATIFLKKPCAIGEIDIFTCFGPVLYEGS
jgi:hypothetical protein